MTTWDDLAAAALLGTGRRTVDVRELPGPGGEAAAALTSGDQAALLLDAAALAAPARRAGRRPTAPAVEPAAPAADGDGDRIGAAATARLAHLLALPQNESNKELLAEWLGAVADVGRSVPPEALPALLDLSVRDRHLAAAVLPALGPRGVWLARFREDWQRVLTAGTGLAVEQPGDDAAEVWATGDTAARRALFGHLRRTDPDTARELLAGTWARETGEDREAFLDAVALDPHPCDEPVLEIALDDRRRAVRDRAVALLRRLPGSAYALRAAERARTVVSVRDGRAGPVLVVTPPAAVDKPMSRDGIAPKPPQGTGERTWWTRQVMAAAPLSVWTTATGLTPEQLLSAEVDDGWRNVVLGAWTDAALAQGDRAWARALLAAGGSAPALLQVLDPAERAAHAASSLRRHPHAPPSDITTLLAACPGPWPDVLADAVVAWLTASPGIGDEWALRHQVRLVAHRLPARYAAAVVSAASRRPDGSPLRAALLTVSDTLAFRHDMLEELR